MFSKGCIQINNANLIKKQIYIFTLLIFLKDF